MGNGNPFGPQKHKPVLIRKFQWNCWGENCPVCESMRGRVYTYDHWYSAGVLPGFHLNCNCTLKEVSAEHPLSDLDFFGTDLQLLSDSYSGWFLLAKNYLPYNLRFTRDITATAAARALSIPEAVKFLWDTRRKRSGFFFGSGIQSPAFFNWRTFRTLQTFQEFDNSRAARVGLPPKRKPLKPYRPISRYSSYYRKNRYNR